MKVSFIVPIYKVAGYIEQCVKSIIVQTYKDYEIILVDDGSPDECPAICDRLADEYSCVKALHKPNGGLSDARNYGLLYANGEYVVFIDGDDFWRHEDSLERLIAIADKNPHVDFIGYNCEYYYPETNKYTPWIKYSNDLSSPISCDVAMQLLVASGTFPMSACLKLLKRSTLIDRNITFRKGQIAEDIPWFINVLDKCSLCMFVNEYVYAYRQNVVGSITASGGERSFNSLLDIVKTEVEKIESRSFSHKAKDALKSFLAYEVSILMFGLCKLPKEKQITARKELKSLGWLLNYTHNPKVNMVSKVYNVFGFFITERVLRLYNWYRLRKG